MTAIQLGMPKVVHYGEGNIFEETPFPKYAKEELKNEQLRANLRFVTHAIRNKRARVTAEVPDWQDLRNTGESVKNYVLANLPELLEQFERNFTAAGGRNRPARPRPPLPHSGARNSPQPPRNPRHLPARN